jgi:hypothetical protein
MLRGARVRHAARCVGGLRAVFGHRSGSGLRLPQAEAPPTVARRSILFGPEPHCRGSGFLRCGVGAVASLGAHTTSKNPRPVSQIQAYIAYLRIRRAFEGCVLLRSQNDCRNVRRNAWQTVVL